MSFSGLTLADTATVSDLTLTMTGTPTPGNNLTFNAQATDWNGSPEYQFWLENADGWHLVQNYSAKNSWSMTANAGSYAIVVYAMNPSQVRAGFWNDAFEATYIANIDSSVTLTVPATGTQGSPVNLSANAANLINPVYQFWIEKPDGTWQGMSYGSAASDNFTPAQPGTYHVIVYAKDPIALPNATDAVWSQTDTITVAPAIPLVANMSSLVGNSLPGFSTPNAVLLGEPATLSAVVTNPNGEPLANVRVVFTASNDSNTGDHITFGEGLSGSAITNQNGVAQTTLMVTNPEDGTNRQLALDANAVAIVGYTVSVPSDPSLPPIDGTVRFVALSSPTLVVNGTPVAPGVVQEPVLSEPASFTVKPDYVVPTVASATPYTIPINYQSGPYGPDTAWSSTNGTLPNIPVNMPFNSATINVQHLGLSTGSTFTVDYVPQGVDTPSYARTFTGPTNANAFGIQIPGNVPGHLVFNLYAPGETNHATATGLAITSVTVMPNGMSGIESRPVTGGSVTWQNEPLQYTAPTPLSSSQASALLGSLYDVQWSYTTKVPVYPEIGDAIITAQDYGTTKAIYAYPTVVNGMGQTALASKGVAVALPANPFVSATLTSNSNSADVSSSQPGLSYLEGTLNIPDVNPMLLQQPMAMLQEGILWMSNSMVQEPISQYALANQSVTVTATVTNANGVPAANTNAFQWQLSGTGYTIKQQDSTTNGQGQAVLVLTANAAAQMKVGATANAGYHVVLSDSGGPFNSAILNWVIPSLTYQSLNGDVIKNGETALASTPSVGTTQDFTAIAVGVTATGQDVSLANVPVSVATTSGSVGSVSPASSTSVANGGIAFSATSTESGAETINLNTGTSLGNIFIGGIPSVGVGSTSGSVISIPLNWQSGVPIGTLAVSSTNPNPGSTVTITVTAKDVYGNPLPNLPITITVSGSTASLNPSGTVTTNGVGVASSILSGGIFGEQDTITVVLPTGQQLQQTVTWG
jgi:hypothetical protein